MEIHRITFSDGARSMHLPGNTFVFHDLAYQIEAVHARGGTAQIYRANACLPAQTLSKSHALCTTLALKLIDESYAKDRVARERFMREGELLCRLAHPNLVKGYAMGEWQDRPLLVMEYIDGTTLSQALCKRKRIPAQESLRLLQDILAALNYLVLDGRVTAHRDIKPSNIMINPSGTAKLIDLGIAKTSLRVENNLDTRFLGSLHYVAPEQIDNAARADVRADIYALGAVFYEMCSGVRAFEGTGSHAILASHFSGNVPELPRIEEFSRDDELWHFCNSLLKNTLAVDCTKRFQTPSQFLDVLAKGTTWHPSDLSISATQDGSAAHASPHDSTPILAGQSPEIHTRHRFSRLPLLLRLAVVVLIVGASIGLTVLVIEFGQHQYLNWRIAQEAPPIGSSIDAGSIVWSEPSDKAA